MARGVVAQDGARWTVGRRWAPTKVRLRRRRDSGDGTDIGDLGFADVFDDPLAIIAVLAAAALLLFLVIVPIVAIALELVILVILFLVSLAGRVVFRRPWTVVARSTTQGASHELEWHVVGWRRSGLLIDAAAGALAAGTELPAGATSGGLAENTP
jgi:hypothetical protein